MVGVRLAELGDQIDTMFGDELDGIVKLAGSPDEAFSSFSTVIRNVFDWDENGLREWLIRLLHTTIEMAGYARFYGTVYLSAYGIRDV